MAMTTYETRLRGARKRLVEALDNAPGRAAQLDIETALGLLNGLIAKVGREPVAMAEAA